MDFKRRQEDRRIHKNRFTYCCDKEDIRALKIIAADLRIPVNKLIHRAVRQYIQSHYTPEQRRLLLGTRTQTPTK